VLVLLDKSVELVSLDQELVVVVVLSAPFAEVEALQGLDRDALPAADDDDVVVVVAAAARNGPASAGRLMQSVD
jgi:hypothetical protein